MPADYAGLKALLATQTYAQMADDAARLAALNAPGATAAVPGSYLAEGGVLKVLGPTAGDAFLTTIEAVAASTPQSGDQTPSILTRCVRILRAIAGGGIDFGDAATQAMLGQIATAQPSIAAQCNALIAHGSAPGPSPAQGLGFPYVGQLDIDHARSLA